MGAGVVVRRPLDLELLDTLLKNPGLALKLTVASPPTIYSTFNYRP